MTFTSNFGYHGCIEAMLGGQPDKKSPNLSKLTETGQGSKKKNPQKERFHDEGGLLRRRLSRGSPPVEGRRAWFSRRARTEQQQQGICGSSPSSSHARRLSAACW